MLRSKIMKRIVAGGLALTLLLSLPMVSLAHGNDHRGKSHDKKSEKKHQPKKQKISFEIKDGQFFGKADFRISFHDLDANWDWVRENIARLVAERIFDGYEDGTFRPNRPVTQLEAIITAVRLMGLREQAESEEEMNTKLNFKDADLIEKKYPQAVGYVAVAVENDLFLETEDKVQPNKSADRLWVATMLVKALGLEDEAKSKMNVQLDFKDARKIPAGSVGYIAVAVDKKIVYGTKDNMFQPNKPVTRAEIAAFLDRAGMQIPDYKDDAIHGTVSQAVYGNVLHLVVDQSNQVYPLDPNAYIFRNGVKVSASDLKVGDEVKVRTYNNLVIFVEVTENATEEEEGVTSTFNGTLTAGINQQTLFIRHDGQSKQYPISNEASFFRNGEAVAASALKSGDEVMVRVENGKVTWVIVTKNVEVNQFSVIGLFSGVTFNSEGQIATISIMQNINGQTQTSVYQTASDVKIEGDASKLVLNQIVELKGKDNTIHTIVVK